MNDFMLHRVRREHERLSALIEREQRRPFPDPWRLVVLKRRKLAVKDRLSGLQARSERQFQLACRLRLTPRPSAAPRRAGATS